MQPIKNRVEERTSGDSYRGSGEPVYDKYQEGNRAKIDDKESD